MLSLTGQAADLHAVRKPAQTLMEYAAGIASATAELLVAARQPKVTISTLREFAHHDPTSLFRSRH